MIVNQKQNQVYAQLYKSNKNNAYESLSFCIHTVLVVTQSFMHLGLGLVIVCPLSLQKTKYSKAKPAAVHK